ncbi:MAG: hypothetical protein AB1898_21285 [Acidobacteriota bacterium]
MAETVHGLRLARPCVAQPELLDQVHEGIRARHSSRRTENACVGWIRKSYLGETGEVDGRTAVVGIVRKRTEGGRELYG